MDNPAILEMLRTEEYFKCYLCTICNNIDAQYNDELHRIVKAFHNGVMFLSTNECCQCFGSGIVPIPFMELMGETYECWKVSKDKAFSEGIES